MICTVVDGGLADKCVIQHGGRVKTYVIRLTASSFRVRVRVSWHSSARLVLGDLSVVTKPPAKLNQDTAS